MKYKVSVWAHVILPMCIAIVVFVLLIIMVVLWSRWKRQKYMRSKMDDAREKDVVTNIVFPDEHLPSPGACTDIGSDGWSPRSTGEVSLVPRDPLVLAQDFGIGRSRSGEDCGVSSKMLHQVDTVDEGLGDDETDAERRSRTSSVSSDCPPESLDSPKIPFTASHHSLLQMEV